MIRGGRERERGALRLGPFGLVAVAALVVAAIALVIILRSGDNGKPSLDKGDTKVSIERSYGKLPLAFEPNAGRYPAGLRYRARSESGSVLLSRSGAELIAASQKPNRFALEFTGGSPTSVVGDDKLDGVVNDLRGDDPARYRTGIPTYAAVRYRRIWSGIDAVYRGTQRRLDYDFRVAPGADPQDIGVRVRGADRLRLAENGDVVITTGGSKFLQKAPVSFQPAANGDARASVESRYTLQGNRIGLEIGDYDRSRPLQIDPVVVTYFASDGAPEDLSDIAVDASGSAYVVGQDEPDEDTYTPDVFVGNYAPDGESFVYSTYLGGTSDDYGSSIAIDSAGAAYITGFTYSSTFPTVNEIQACTGASYLHSEAFVTKLAPDGGSLTYSTCLGGSDYDYGRGIAVDGSGNCDDTGHTVDGESSGCVCVALPGHLLSHRCMRRSPPYTATILPLPSDIRLTTFSGSLVCSSVCPGFRLTAKAVILLPRSLQRKSRSILKRMVAQSVAVYSSSSSMQSTGMSMSACQRASNSFALRSGSKAARR